MHELSLMKGLLLKLEEIVRSNGAARVVRVRVRLGALSHFSEEHFREHFEHASQGTAAEGADLEVVMMTDAADPNAQDVILVSADVEEP